MPTSPDTPRVLRRSLRAPGAAMSVTVLLAAVLAATIPAPGRAAAASEPFRAASGPTAPLTEAARATVPGLDPRLVGAPISGPAGQAIGRLARAESSLADLRARVAALGDEEARLQVQLDHFTAEERAAAEELAATEGRKRRLAAAAYMNDPGVVRQFALLDAGGPVEVARRGQLADRVGATLGDLADLAGELREVASEAVEHVADELVDVRARRDETEQQVRAVTADLETAAAAVRELLPTATVASLDVPLVTLDAYLRAERLAAARDPGCGVPWWALAGIGRTESDHGRYRDSAPDAAGDVSPPILGVPLDGDGVAVIGDSDGGALDGDVGVDRAVGPMQFIPSTWARHRQDATFDGRADPQNVYDAAFSASRYLCAVVGGPMDSDAALRRGFFGYNHSLAYVTQVHAHAFGYRSAADFLTASS